MKRPILMGLGIFVAAAVLLLYSSMFIVHQAQQALVLQFGNPVRVVRDPGLGFKLPFIQQVEYFDRRVLDFDAPSVELVLGDQKRLVVDAFARYRIADPLRFRQAAGTELAFRGRLEPIVFSSLRSVLGEASLFTVLSEDRNSLMREIQDEANRALNQFGIEVVDIRIKRADLPAENSQAIFRRMQTEREREARELRAQGAEIGQRIRARADRERRVLIAEAQKQSEILRGEGDAEAVRIFAEAFGQDMEFFDFYRSLQAYRTALGDGATSFVIRPDSPFFRYFGHMPSQSGPGSLRQPAPSGSPLSELPTQQPAPGGTAAPGPASGQAAAVQP